MGAIGSIATSTFAASEAKKQAKKRRKSEEALQAARIAIAEREALNARSAAEVEAATAERKRLARSRQGRQATILTSSALGSPDVRRATLLGQ